MKVPDEGFFAKGSKVMAPMSMESYNCIVVSGVGVHISRYHSISIDGFLICFELKYGAFMPIGHAFSAINIDWNCGPLSSKFSQQSLF